MVFQRKREVSWKHIHWSNQVYVKWTQVLDPPAGDMGYKMTVPAWLSFRVAYVGEGLTVIQACLAHFKFRLQAQAKRGIVHIASPI
jgi:hypothetical protein